ncbi:MAG: tRNA 4-thiouridine(8) synthase ThiI [Deltaproteobacteria bacterium]|nr:tRNA 4-thiouridine(8) synthase ThiI [Deltaproteobacteria bacterium]
MKALSVFSGGLDSILAAHLILSQGIEVQAIFFSSPFFPPKNLKKSVEQINLPLKVIDITERLMEIIKHPKYGYGGNMNPCIDCHTLMFRIAGEMLETENAKFIITGEVLGQRPMSQNKKALETIASESGYKGLILRPLSAGLLEITIPEKNGWVKRKDLLSLSGRSRKPQMELARKYNISNYPSPAGGCLLTDNQFSRRLRDLLLYDINPEPTDLELLKIGRHFRIDSYTKVIVGRNKAENTVIQSMARKDDFVLIPVSIPGPTVIVTGKRSQQTTDLAAVMAVSYSDARAGERIDVKVANDNYLIPGVKGMDKNVFKRYMIY